MSHKETYHLPSVVLEMEFMGEASKMEGLGGFRPSFKQGLMKRLIADGVVFEEKGVPQGLKGGEGPLPRIEDLVDGWVLAHHYRCTKAKDKHSGKVWWVLDCEEQVSILMLPAGE